MSEIKTIFSIGLKKIEGTINDYEQLLILDPCFQILAKEDLTKIEDIASKAVEDIKLVLKTRDRGQPQ